MQIEVKVKTRQINLDPKTYNTRIGQYMVSSTQKKIRSGNFKRNAPLTVAVKQNAKPLQDTGLLMASITSRATEQKAIVGTNREGAAMNQFGGTKRPKPGKYLWLPASAKTRTLLRRYGNISNVIKGLKSQGYRTWTKPTKSGGRIFYYAKPKGKVEKLFYLQTRVDVPARPFLYVSNNDRKAIEDICINIIRENKQ